MFEGIHRIDTASVRFAFYPDGYDGARILGDISENTLRDIWGAHMCEQGLIELCTQNFELIETMAIAAYRTDSTRPIVLSVSDFNIPTRADGDRMPP